METRGTPIEVFCSYSDSSEDVPLLEQLESHLSSLENEGLISTWHKRQLAPGSDRQKEIEHHLNSAGLILLLVSSDFLTDYCRTEMERALQRHVTEQTLVMPILLRPCLWQSTPFARLEVLPTATKPITQWSDRDAAWDYVVTRIRKALVGKLGTAGRNITGTPRWERENTPKVKAARSRKWFVSVLLFLVIVAIIIGSVVYIPELRLDLGGVTQQKMLFTPTPGMTATPTQPKTYPEQEGALGSVTYSNPHNLSGVGPQVEPGKQVEVSCKMLAPSLPSVSPDGYWYRIASHPWDNTYYAIANTFLNGDILGQRPYTHNTDLKVPNC